MIISDIFRFRRKNMIAGLLTASLLSSMCLMPAMAEEVPDENGVLELTEEFSGTGSTENASVDSEYELFTTASSPSVSGNTSENKASRNPDGSWNYTVSQQEALSFSPLPELYFPLENTGSDLSLCLSARTVISYNKSKSALRDSIVDLSRSTASINGTYVNIKKVHIKNYRHCYVASDSLFADLISENNLSAYSYIPESKRPMYYVVLDGKSAPLDVKKAVKEANRVLKKNPILIEMLPVDLTPFNLVVEYNTVKGTMRKLMIYDDEGKLTKLTHNKDSKKDYSYSSSGREILITGTNNYNNSVLFNPANSLSFY